MSSSKRNNGNRSSTSFKFRPGSLWPPRKRISYDWQEFSSIEIEPERGGSTNENRDGFLKKRRASRKWSVRNLLCRSRSEGREQRMVEEKLLAALPLPGLPEKTTKAAKEADQLEAGKSINGRSARKKRRSASVSAASTPPHYNNNSPGRNKVAVSVHELYYQANRAHSEELKRQSFLPYRQGLLSCLGPYPSTTHQCALQTP